MNIDNRFSPRVKVKLTAVIFVTEDLSLEVITTNVSQNGVCVQCNMTTRNLITPGGCFMRGLHPLELGIILDAPDKAKETQIQAQCQVLYSRRVAKDQCQIGLKFKHMDPDSRTLMQEIIDSVLQIKK